MNCIILAWVLNEELAKSLNNVTNNRICKFPNSYLLVFICEITHEVMISTDRCYYYRI